MFNVLCALSILLIFPLTSVHAGKEKKRITKDCVFPYSILYEKTGDNEWAKRIHVYAYDTMTMPKSGIPLRLLFGLEGRHQGETSALTAEITGLGTILGSKGHKLSTSEKKMVDEHWTITNYVVQVPYVSLADFVTVHKERLQFTREYGSLRILGLNEVVGLGVQEILGSYLTASVNIDFSIMNSRSNVVARETDISLEVFLDKIVALCELERWSKEDYQKLTLDEARAVQSYIKEVMAITVQGVPKLFALGSNAMEELGKNLPQEFDQRIKVYIAASKEKNPTPDDAARFKQELKDLLKNYFAPYHVRFMRCEKDVFVNYKMMVTHDVTDQRGPMVGFDEAGNLKTTVVPISDPGKPIVPFMSVLYEIDFDLMPSGS